MDDDGRGAGASCARLASRARHGSTGGRHRDRVRLQHRAAAAAAVAVRCRTRRVRRVDRLVARQPRLRRAASVRGQAPMPRRVELSPESAAMLEHDTRSGPARTSRRVR